MTFVTNAMVMWTVCLLYMYLLVSPCYPIVRISRIALEPECGCADCTLISISVTHLAYFPIPSMQSIENAFDLSVFTNFFPKESDHWWINLVVQYTNPYPTVGQICLMSHLQYADSVALDQSQSDSMGYSYTVKLIWNYNLCKWYFTQFDKSLQELTAQFVKFHLSEMKC